MDALVAGTLIKEDPLNLGLLVGTPGWDPHLPGSRPPGFNGAGFGSSTTGPPYGFDPSTDIRRARNSNGKVTYFSSSGLARRLCRCVTVRNDAMKALNAAVATGASRDEIKNLQEELEYQVTQIRQCEWMFENGYFLRAELDDVVDTTGRSCKRSRPDTTSQSPTGMPAAQAAGDNCKSQWQLHKEQTAAAEAMAAALPKPPAVMAQTPLNGITEADAQQIRNEGRVAV